MLRRHSNLERSEESIKEKGQDKIGKQRTVQQVAKRLRLPGFCQVFCHAARFLSNLIVRSWCCLRERVIKLWNWKNSRTRHSFFSRGERVERDQELKVWILSHRPSKKQKFKKYLSNLRRKLCEFFKRIYKNIFIRF